MVATTHNNFSEVINGFHEEMISDGEIVDTTSWQGRSGEQFRTIELLNRSFTVPISSTIQELEMDIKPNLPWARTAFEERIGGIPTNPGYAYKSWPYYKDERGMREVKDGIEPQFSHTYQERYWAPAKPGIRYAWGNLGNVVSLLLNDPYTRQAYLPVFFPEDTGGGATSIGYVPRRIPCSLGYHFLLRSGRLHCWYEIRSCDLMRHFQDDIYLTCRLDLWVLEELRKKSTSSPIDSELWSWIVPGTLTMSIHSLHMFYPSDLKILKYRRSHGNAAHK